MIFFFLFACSSASSDLGAAKQLEEKGALTEAFDKYVEIKKNYQGTSAAKQADRSLQRIYLRHAKKKTEKEPDTAIAIYEVILKRWPSDSIGEFASKEIERISSEKVEQERRIQEEASFCSKAKKAGSRVLWQQYKQNHPDGKCVSEAEAFLASSQPREREQEEMVRLAKECSNALRLACTEYNLAKTTSVDEACQNPSTAFATEFSRLLQRKKTLLAEGNQEYYETFILKRWDSVQNGLTTVCSDSSLYLEELSKQGIDVEELTKTLKASCSACVTKPNDIRQ